MLANYDESAIVIPCYNEEKRLNVEEYIEELKDCNSKIIFVDDGSNDNTFDILKKINDLFPEKTFVIRKAENTGKAEAIRTGMLYASEKISTLKYTGFIDADLAVRLSEISYFLDILKFNSCIAVIGVRAFLAGHRIQRTKFQYFIQRIIAVMGKILFNKNVIDTQCGAKLFEANILKQVIEEPFVSKWLVDQEILTRISKLQELSDKNWLFEYPVTAWREIGNSHIRIYDYLKCLFEYFRILCKYKF